MSLASNEFEHKRGKRRYELSNHLGNVLAVVSDKRTHTCLVGTTFDHYAAEIISANDYYPFGMIMPNRTYQNGAYKFGLQGQENDIEVAGAGNSLDFGARIYDSGLGRWMGLDDHSKPFHSNYEFAYSNPILIVDKDGYDEVIYDPATGEVEIINTNGPLVYREIVYKQISQTEGGSIYVGSFKQVDWRTSQNFHSILVNNDKMYNFLLRSGYSVEEQSEIFSIKWDHDRTEMWEGVLLITGGGIVVGIAGAAATVVGVEAGGAYILKERAELVIEETLSLQLSMGLKT